MVDTVQAHEAIGGATKRGAPDPNVKIPPAVKAAADRAEALAAQAKTAREANNASGANEPLGPNGVATQPAPSSTVVTANFDPSNPRPPGSNDLVASPQSSAPQPPAPQPPAPQTPEDWEHQFRSLKGRYDRETEEKRRLQQQLVDTQRLMAQIGSPPAPTPEGSGVRFNIAPPPPGRRLTPKEVQEYGEETLDVMGRRAAEVYEPVLQALTTELQQIRRMVGGVQNSVVYDARVKMYDDLAREVPNWDAINNSPQFAQWLDAMDPISHRSRREFLTAAHNSNQTGQVVDIFKAFLGSLPPQGEPMLLAAPAPANGGYSQSNPQNDLLQYAAPGRAKAGQTTVPPEKPVFQAAEITQFYRDKTAGKYAGREAEADALERAMIQAGNEGRILRR